MSCDIKKRKLYVANPFLRVPNLRSCKLPFTCCKFKEIILRVASCVLWVEKFFYELPVESLRWSCLRVAKLPVTR